MQHFTRGWAVVAVLLAATGTAHAQTLTPAQMQTIRQNVYNGCSTRMKNNDRAVLKPEFITRYCHCVSDNLNITPDEVATITRTHAASPSLTQKIQDQSKACFDQSKAAPVRPEGELRHD